MGCVDLVEGRFVGWQPRVEMLPQVIVQCFVGWKVSTMGTKLSKKGNGPGRLPTARASPAAQRVSCVILENGHIILDGLQLATSLCNATIHAILADLKTKKFRANWVRRDLTPERNERRVHHCQELLVLQNNDGRGSLPCWLLVLSYGFTVKLWS
jgi:hypothetical protein